MFHGHIGPGFGNDLVPALAIQLVVRDSPRARADAAAGEVLVEHVVLPEPVVAPDEVHLLDGHVLRLRQEEHDEERHDDDEGREEEEEPVLEVAERHEEELRDEEGPEEVDGHDDRLPRRPDLQREDLARHEPPERAPRPSERRHVEADEYEHPVREAFYDLTEDHLHAALEEEPLAADAVDGDDGNERGEDIDGACDDRGHEGGVRPKAEGLEEDGGVEHDDVDAGELLRRRDDEGHDQLRPVVALEDVPPRVLHPRRLLARLDHVLQLRVDVVSPADLLQRRLRFLVVPALDQRVRGVRQAERSERHDARGDRRERQRYAPPVSKCIAVPAVDLVGAVVDEVGDEDADGDVEGAAELWGGHLGEVEGDGLVGEADSEAEEDAADDEHGEVDGGTVEGGADEEVGAAD
ncbi:hypothetical protein ACMD2_02325 [Ananas comosus]|uniref:Uncharacterized protein n=1 Tax=Ananas comosus TaxID=4615 RepID=A0A199VD14_ANACO|nr:hypothetical protein ACMD2_02325 [Ananas comosus]